jgi:DNA integrity scanning protein DisA with diadenylate cyclase activity
MLQTIFMIGLFALLGLFVLKLVFGLFGWLFTILLWLLGAAIQVAVLGLIIYLVIRVFSPETARRLRERFSGTP